MPINITPITTFAFGNKKTKAEKLAKLIKAGEDPIKAYILIYGITPVIIPPGTINGQPKQNFASRHWVA